MSAEDCPFQIIRLEVDEDSSQNDSYIKFEIPIDPNDADGLKSNIQFRKLNSDEPEDVLTHIQRFDALVNDLFRLFKLCLAPNAQKTWTSVLDDLGDDRDQDAFETAIENFLLKKVERDCALNTKEWLNQIKKPRTMTVKKFVERIMEINNLIPYMPLPEDNAEEDDRIEAYSEAELRNILKKAVPRQ